MKKNNLFIFHPYSGIGGADRSIARVINGIKKKNLEIFFISLKKPKIKIFIKKKINYITLNESRTLFGIIKLKKIIKNLISKETKNIFLSNQNYANVLSIFFLRKIDNLKLVLIERNSLKELYFHSNLMDLLKKKIIKYLIKKTYNKANLVICICKDLEKEIKKFTKSKTMTIYNPALDQQIYSLRSYKKIKKPKKKLVLLNVSRLEKQKDHITLLKAINLLKNKLSFILYIIGYGSEYGEMKKFISENKLSNKVKIIKSEKNPNNYFKISDLFILSSKYEGFANVIVESGFNKVPVIASNCNHGPKEILNGNSFGTLFNVGDYNELSKKILLFSKNQTAFRKKSYRFHKSLGRFDTIKIIKKYEKMLNNI